MAITINSTADLEEYILRKLREVFSPYPRPIQLDTLFSEINREIDPEAVDIGFLLDIEDDLEVDISEEDAESIDAGNVDNFIQMLAGKLNL